MIIQLFHDSSLHAETIVNKIKESGFQISLSNETTLTREMAEQLYNNQRDKEYFEELVTMMSRQVGGWGGGGGLPYTC